MNFIQQFQNSLEEMNGYHQALSVGDFIVPSKDTNQLIIRENDDDAEVLICLQESRLNALQSKSFPEDFSLEVLPDLSIVVEELSHFNTYSLAAEAGREISGLELEVQGEVDKFAVALEYLHLQNEISLREKVFEVLFDRCRIAPWIPADLEPRYRDAHEIARNFCRTVLKKNPDFDEMKQSFRDFFETSRGAKLGLKF